MLIKRIGYDTYDGDHIEENFYFNLTKTEAMTLQVSKEGGFESFLHRIIDAHNGKEIMQTVEEIILLAYGEKSPDGKHLMKSDEIRQKFKCSPAYDELFTELVLDDKKMSDFVNTLLPKDMDSFIEKLNKRSEAAGGTQLNVIDGDK